MRAETVRRLSRLHTWLLRASRGRLGNRLVKNDMLLLTTRGRRTGRTHTVPLLYLRDGDALVIIASWGGRDHHPHWYLNLAADPTAEVSVRGRTWRVKARSAAGTERATWWHRAVDAYPGYAEYQARTHREIPIVVLEREPD